MVGDGSKRPRGVRKSEQHGYSAISCMDVNVVTLSC